jgi:RNA-binding protein
MRRVGAVTRIAQGLAVVRCVDGDHPAIGSTVVTEDLTDAGRVVDVFGPVQTPYVAVSPPTEVRLPTLVGDPLYAQ